MIQRSIVWFKTDLRLEDNETLVKAIQSSKEIIPVYCLDTRQFSHTASGRRKMGFFRAKFLLECMQDLRSQLKELGSDLLVVTGNPVELLPELVLRYGVKKVFAKREVAHDEKTEEEAVRLALLKLGCDFESTSTSTLYHAEDLPFAITHIPDLFTNFRKQVEKESPIRAAFKKPDPISSPRFNTTELPGLSELGFEHRDFDVRSVMRFAGGEREALKRLHYYLFTSKAVAHYKNTRNELLGADSSSKLSPWLAFGCISPRFIHQQLLLFEQEHGANESTYWLRFELLWRDFFRFMFKKHGNRYFQINGINKHQPATVPNNSALFDAWKTGNTGQTFVDANMRELWHTGFMSNRGRQNVASYFCHQLQLDWRLGASWFEEQLIDYDVCNNWGNWAYIAGVGNDARHRQFDVNKQAATYDGDKLYQNLWLQ